MFSLTDEGSLSARRRECFAAGNDLMVLKQGGVQYAGRCWTEDAPGEAGIMRMWRKASAKREYLLFSLHRASLPAAAVRFTYTHANDQRAVMTKVVPAQVADTMDKLADECREFVQGGILRI